MTPLDRTASASPKNSRLIAWVSVGTGIAAAVAVVALGLSGHPETAAAVGAIGGAAFAAGGVTVTVNVRK
ncbi:hypothetical protein ACIGO8_33045 [Streptomyces sp. NPDC053493]|uniref:hypothetical protein n=1 Tax=Streptomyces sp. NPDC053493 TaxID=3365705 RepID=UPI0037D768AD